MAGPSEWFKDLATPTITQETVPDIHEHGIRDQNKFTVLLHKMEVNSE